MKNKIFFIIYLLFNPLLLKLIVKGIYLPVYVQYEWLKLYKIDTIIDAGAYYGHVTKSLNYLFPNAKIYAFEPVEENCEIIEKRVNSKNVVLTRCGLSDKKGTSKFYKYDNPALSSTLSINYNNTKFKAAKKIDLITIKTDTLDNFFKDKKIKGNVLLKIDTQGSEFLILQGGKNLLRKISIIHLETSFDEFYNKQFLFSDIYAFLTKFGFTYYGENREAEFYPTFAPSEHVNSIFINRAAFKG